MIDGRLQIRVCNTCSQSKEESDFYTQVKLDVTGEKYLARECKVCSRQRAKNYRDNNRKLISAKSVKKRTEQKEKTVAAFGDKCADCGKQYPICCYDFHHLDPSKKEKSIGNAFNGYSNIQDELEKCVMLCSNCHRIRHYLIRMETYGSNTETRSNF